MIKAIEIKSKHYLLNIKFKCLSNAIKYASTSVVLRTSWHEKDGNFFIPKKR